MYVLDPYHYFCIVEAAADVMQRIQLADSAAPAGRLIVMPGMSASGGVGSDDAGDRRGKAQGGAILNLLVGRVWWVGPGKNWEGAFVVPKCKRGDLILFSPRVVSHEWRMLGRSFKVVPFSECVSGVRWVDPESAEGREVTAFLELTKKLNDEAAQLSRPEAV